MPADYEELFNIIESKKELFSAKNDVQEKFGRIVLVSDSAHSIGAEYKGKKAGLIADMSSFSFHAVKNLTTAEGGAVVFNVADKFNQLQMGIVSGERVFKVIDTHSSIVKSGTVEAKN